MKRQRPKGGRWYAIAEHTICTVAERCQREGTSPAATLAAIDAAYPFGHRGHWPYQAWLKARRAWRAGGTPAEVADREKLRAWQSGEPLQIKEHP